MAKIISSKKSDKKSDKSSSKKSSAGASSKSEETQKVVSNPRLVAAFKSHDNALAEAKSYLITAAKIAIEEQLTKAEVVASIMEARGVAKVTAETQYSRIKKLMTDPDLLQQMEDGEVDLKTARSATKSTQRNKSPEKTQANNEKKFSGHITSICNLAKELGTDLVTLLNTIKAQAKKAGLK